eukprot:3393143-Pleurochrysis_carterae.AAC.3
MLALALLGKLCSFGASIPIKVCFGASRREEDRLCSPSDGRAGAEEREAPADVAIQVPDEAPEV